MIGFLLSQAVCLKLDCLSGFTAVIKCKTKGESYFPSVALASVIARYRFLLKKDELSAKYGVEFLMGASSKVDELAKTLLEKLGIEEFTNLVKKDFRNYKRIMGVSLLKKEEL